MQKITPCLWYDNEAEEAANLYISIFKNSKITDITRYPEGARGEPGTAMTVTFELDGVEFVGLNGGPQFKFNEAASFQIHTADQAETDRIWNALIADGGEEGQCSWCKDKYGLSWQVTPDRLIELLKSPDKGVAMRVAAAMMQMSKIDIAKLEAAAG